MLSRVASDLFADQFLLRVDNRTQSFPVPPATTGSASGGAPTSPGQHSHADGTVHNNADDSAHAHGNGTHDGVVADWGGGKFHVEFIVDHDNLGIVKEYEGSISGVVDGTPYSGNFKELPHGDKLGSASFAKNRARIC